MQNDGIEETIVKWWNNIPNELKIQKEIESSYDKVMEIILNILIFGIN